MNTKERGDIAVGEAINYFLKNGYEVSLPIGDKRHYDFLIEKEGKINRIQVKFAGIQKTKNQCRVGLRITGGNQSFHYAKKYPDDAFDFLFVYTERDEKYLLPWKEVTCRNEITIENKKYKMYNLK
ncbi:group I intron-associated PD-(D/E)XK endonuclease [Patescibacteria group bacterium]|nr:group I intron-associated PD-(D/E)XK endonuclease [Patescibacteria group bacterium]